MSFWNFGGRAVVALAAVTVVLSATGAAPAAAAVIDGGGAVAGSVSWGADSGPAVVGGCSTELAGHMSLDFAVAFTVGSVSYAGPIHFESDFASLPGWCGSFTNAGYGFSDATMQGSSPSGTISCDVSASPYGGWAQSGALTLFGTGLIPCTVNGQSAQVAFSADGVLTPLVVTASTAETAALLTAVAYVGE